MSLYDPSIIATGGDTVQDINGSRIHTFTTVGTSSFVVTRGGPVEVLVVAGGGSGGVRHGGGGGAGGLIYNTSFIVAPNSVTVTVGDGGAARLGSAGAGAGNSGSNSVFGSLTAIGGGYGNPGTGGAGGSGGGGWYTGVLGGTGTPGQGNQGGMGSQGPFINENTYAGGGGGGAGGAGGNSTSIAPAIAGSGGNGLQYSISGTPTYYAGGGGGSTTTSTGSGATGGSGGLGGGGAGSGLVNNPSDGVSGTNGTGGGGGAGGWTGSTNFNSGKGGSGIVIVRYPLGTLTAGPQPKIFLGPLFSYPSSSGTQPTSDGTKVSFARASSQYMNFGSQTFDMSRGFSVTCRFAFTGTLGNWERIIDFGNGPASDNIFIARLSNGNTIRFVYINSATEYVVTSTNSVSQDQINTVTAIYNPSPLSLTIILNGVTTTSNPAVAATTPRTLAFCYVGRSNWSGDAYLNGDIYSLNIYNRALTPNELTGPPAPSPWGIFTATPNGLTSAQAATSGLALRQGYPGYTSGTYWLKPTSGSTPGLAFVDMTTDGGGWTLVYETVTATRASGSIVYSFNNSSNLSALSFTRVAYSMNNFNSWAFTSFDSWSSTITNYRIPSTNDVLVNQRLVTNLNVISSNTNVTTGTGLNGALEIWPYNYSTGRALSMGTYGSDATFDINDTYPLGGAYGSFQVHDITNSRPVICWNNHDSASPDIGFGPQASNNPDWTFTNGGATADFRVRVFVR